jgi:hypothetical protein
MSELLERCCTLLRCGQVSMAQVTFTAYLRRPGRKPCQWDGPVVKAMQRGDVHEAADLIWVGILPSVKG